MLAVWSFWQHSTRNWKAKTWLVNFFLVMLWHKFDCAVKLSEIKMPFLPDKKSLGSLTLSLVFCISFWKALRFQESKTYVVCFWVILTPSPSKNLRDAYRERTPFVFYSFLHKNLRAWCPFSPFYYLLFILFLRCYVHLCLIYIYWNL